MDFSFATLENIAKNTDLRDQARNVRTHVRTRADAFCSVNRFAMGLEEGPSTSLASLRTERQTQSYAFYLILQIALKEY